MNLEENEYLIQGVTSGSIEIIKERPVDAFNYNWESLRLSGGLNKNFVRRTDRHLKKAETLPQGDSAKSKQLVEEMIYQTGYGAFDVITPPYNLLELSQYYETTPANHASVDTKVANMVGLGYHWELSSSAVARMDEKDTEAQRSAARRKVERLKAYLDKWLDGLNDEDSFIDVLEKVTTDWQATGNGYLEIGRKTSGEIGYIGHIPATTVRVRRLRDGFCQMVNNKVVFFGNYRDTERNRGYNPITSDPNPNELLHIKMYSPLNTYYGVPDVVSAGQALIGDVLAQQYNIDYFENKAVPRYLITVKGAKLDPKSEEKLFEFLQANLKGQNHRTLIVPLPPDNDQTRVEFKMEPIESGVQESSFNNYHLSNRNDILMAHQVPLSKIGQGDGSLAGTIASDRTFKEQVARPGQRKIEKRINRVISEVTDVVAFKLNELTLTDELAQSQIDEKYVRSQVLTPNEVRDSLGKPPRPGGDKPLELTTRQQADRKNNASGNDQRAIDRENQAADSPTTVSGRKPKGESEQNR